MAQTTKLESGRKVNIRRLRPMREGGIECFPRQLQKHVRRVVFETVEPVTIMPYDKVKDRTTLAKWLYDNYEYL